MSAADGPVPECWLFEPGLHPASKYEREGRSFFGPDSTLYVEWRSAFWPAESESAILRDYSAGLERHGIAFPGGLESLATGPRRSMHSDLMRTMGVRRQEWRVREAPYPPEEARFLAVFRVAAFLDRAQPGFRYRQTMFDLLLVVWHVVYRHFQVLGAALHVVEANAVFAFTRIMVASGQVRRIPGADNFLAEKGRIEQLIAAKIEGHCDSVKQQGMAMINAMKWMMTMFVHEFQLQDVLKIWKDVLAVRPISAIGDRLAELCAYVFSLLGRDTIVHNSDALLAALGQLDGRIVVDELLRYRGQGEESVGSEALGASMNC
jgi:hypothetical protein